MRGRPNPQRSMLAIVDLEERIPQDHPLRRIKEVADAALAQLSPLFDRMYASVGRAVPPERLLKASLLIALYSVRSERAFCEELEYNLLYRWFLTLYQVAERLLAHPGCRAVGPALFCHLRRDGRRWISEVLDPDGEPAGPHGRNSCKATAARSHARRHRTEHPS